MPAALAAAGQTDSGASDPSLRAIAAPHDSHLHEPPLAIQTQYGDISRRFPSCHQTDQRMSME